MISSDSPSVQPLPEEAVNTNLQLRNADSIICKDDLLSSIIPKEIINAHEVNIHPVSLLKVTQF